MRERGEGESGGMKHKADIEGWRMKLASPVASWLGLCDSEQYLNESNEFGNSVIHLMTDAPGHKLHSPLCETRLCA